MFRRLNRATSLRLTVASVSLALSACASPVAQTAPPLLSSTPAAASIAPAFADAAASSAATATLATATVVPVAPAVAPSSPAPASTAPAAAPGGDISNFTVTFAEQMLPQIIGDARFVVVSVPNDAAQLTQGVSRAQQDAQACYFSAGTNIQSVRQFGPCSAADEQQIFQPDPRAQFAAKTFVALLDQSATQARLLIDDQSGAMSPDAIEHSEATFVYDGQVWLLQSQRPIQ